tara:strand:+ start:11595 stop:12557 length:963 start_codon:yes stop_codon:yes gene_type:complete
MTKDSTIFIAGARGMVGSAIVRALRKDGYNNLLTPNREELDLTRQLDVEDFFKSNNIEIVIDCAAKVGGIHSNNLYRADFIYSNLQIQNNVIHSSYKNDIKKLLFLGSSCIYPKFTDQPIKEEYLLRSPLEYTNEPYAVAKIAGIKMCESYYKQYGCNFLSLMPCNQYGPNDNFHPENSHVLPALLRRFHEAYTYNYKSVKIWGTGRAKREFLHVDDLASACLTVLNKVEAEQMYEEGISHFNAGYGEDISIAELAQLIKETTEYDGEIEFEIDKPEGTLRKVMDISRLKKFGWEPKISLKEGLASTYDWFKNTKEVRSV